MTPGDSAPVELTNRLGAATSPYLLQHADNPVDWQEWGDEAFAEARAARRPGPAVASGTPPATGATSWRTSPSRTPRPPR